MSDTTSSNGVKEEVFTLEDVSVFYGDNMAVDKVNLPIYKN